MNEKLSKIVDTKRNSKRLSISVADIDVVNLKIYLVTLVRSPMREVVTVILFLSDSR